MAQVANEIEKVLANRERLADEILINKQAVIDYDRRRNGNREGLNQLNKGKIKNDKKVWMMAGGDLFIRLPTKEAKDYIEKDQNQLTEKIDTARTIMKQNVKKLEGYDMKGFDLKSITSDDLYGITKE
ncbi:p53 and DNA damage-regulated protein 1-like protein [Phascolomyces articulosus]|uniref:P53 and DNA damage-regulated protein 1-like protein n=1 Tax=Phascolomyces articulosus TaxID=60185 RepID=A0AAD5P8I7_9FUNG|nr:p53 and DNA damage-regulated protein 1-like protein [Phascolomyces articulosus]